MLTATTVCRPGPGLDSAPIYVVDDDPASRESLHAFLKARGFDVAAFDSGESLLREIDPSQEGCLITDLKMPGMNGLELQEELARRNYYFPVIIVTGYADVPVAVRAMRNGAVTLLEKPYHDRELAAAVEEAMRLLRERHQKRDRIEQIRSRTERLTSGEREILDRLLQGQSNKTIAGELDLGLRTVERRRHMILEKMNVASLPELARMMAEMELA